MDKKELDDLVSDHISKRNYYAAVSVLKSIENSEYQEELAHRYLCIVGMENVIEKFGEVYVSQNREEYDRIKAGRTEVPKEAVLYRGPEDAIEGLEEMIDYVPKDNPLKVFYSLIKGNED